MLAKRLRKELESLSSEDGHITLSADEVIRCDEPISVLSSYSIVYVLE